MKEKVKAQRKIKEMEKTRNEKRKKLYVSQDEIERKKEALITDIEEKLEEKVTEKELFVIRFTVERVAEIESG